MLYLVAILLPPLGVLLAGKPFQAFINIFLTLAFYFPGLIHALFVVNNHYADSRMKRTIAATKQAVSVNAGPASGTGQAEAPPAEGLGEPQPGAEPEVVSGWIRS